MLLGSTNPLAREHAEGALVRLSIENKNRVSIIKKLVTMLQDPAAGGQEQAAAALANLARESADNRKSIVDANGIPPLLTLMDSTSSKAKENSVGAITQLCRNSKENQASVMRAGGIPKLVVVLLSFSSQSFFFSNSSSSSSRSISPSRLIRVTLASLTNASRCSQKTRLGLSLSLFFSLSVFSLCESKSALFITPHDESSMTRRSALRRKDIESMMHDLNARKPTKKFGTRLFKDDVCSYNNYPRDSVRTTASPTLSRER